MGTMPPEIGQPYRAALEEEWENMIKYYKKHNDQVLFPITAQRDTALHVAVFSKKKKPLKDLLDIIESFPIVIEENALMIQNAFGQTPLHEAATCGNYKAVELLVQAYPQLLLVKNVYGETPLFRAAVFGHTKIVQFLAGQPNQMVDNKKILQDHRVRKDTTTILQVAIQGEHFDTALMLLRLDESLRELQDNRGITGLHLLANVPSAFRSGYSAGLFERVLYFCLPVEYDAKADYNQVSLRRREDEEYGQRMNQDSRFSSLNVCEVLKGIGLSISRFIFEGWPIVERIWEAKKRHETALRLAKLLIKKDVSLNKAMTVLDSDAVSVETFNPIKAGEGLGEVQTGNVENQIDGGLGEVAEGNVENERGLDRPRKQAAPAAPLLTATSEGIIEIVREILKEYPQAVEYHNDMGQNILHVAVMYRRNEIFNLVRRKKIPLSRMHHAIDRYGYTLLHHAADIKHYTGGTSPGPALQLQEELQWFERVRKIVPSHYTMHCDKVHKETARELFDKQHKMQLEVAQKWIKETSQSCSAVAVLVATVVFAAAYTVPGGYDEGVPIFLHSPVFLFFTIMDVVALASSLTSLVMFLSVLTSPFEFKDFLYSLPQKLIIGFILLFFSVMTTMLAFAATVLLLIRSSKNWTTGLISVAAFLPVSVYALMQFHLYVAFVRTMKNFFKAIREAFPWFCIPSLSHKRE